MKSIKIPILVLGLIISIQTQAYVPYIINPYAWYKDIQNAYRWRTDSARMLFMYTKLNQLYHARIEVDNLAKVYDGTQKMIADNMWADPKIMAALNRDTARIYTHFMAKQNEWAPYTGYSDRCRLETLTYFKNKLEQTLITTEKEFDAELTALPASWHSTLKAAVLKLPTKEFHKSPEEREKEFREWQQKDRRSFRNKFTTN